MTFTTLIGEALHREMAARAAFECAVKALRNLVDATEEFTKANCTDEAYPALRKAWREARELLHSVDGTQPAGELPPIPPLDVPPIPASPVVGPEFWRRGDND